MLRTDMKLRKNLRRLRHEPCTNRRNGEEHAGSSPSGRSIEMVAENREKKQKKRRIGSAGLSRWFGRVTPRESVGKNQGTGIQNLLDLGREMMMRACRSGSWLRAALLYIRYDHVINLFISTMT
jgi:hypothetical protein